MQNLKKLNTLKSNTHDGNFGKNYRQCWFKDVNYSHKKMISDAWLGPGCASTDWQITSLKTKICKDGRQVKVELF